jgi:hypothetical protein
MTQTNGQNNIYSIFRDKLSLVKRAHIPHLMFVNIYNIHLMFVNIYNIYVCLYLQYHTYAKVLLKYHTSYDNEHANMVAFKISHLQIPDF